jgi:hypothetical protein
MEIERDVGVRTQTEVVVHDVKRKLWRVLRRLIWVKLRMRFQLKRPPAPGKSEKKEVETRFRSRNRQHGVTRSTYNRKESGKISEKSLGNRVAVSNHSG